MDLNIEGLYKMIFDEYNWDVGYIESNAFITTDSNNEITTWGTIKYSEKYKVYYKYEEQLNNSYIAFEKWKNGGKWILSQKNNCEGQADSCKYITVE